MTLILRHLPEVAAVVSASSSHVVEATAPVSDNVLHDMWTHSRRRLHAWLRIMHHYESDVRHGGSLQRRICWERLEPVIEEILVADSLTRMWVGMMIASDIRRDTVHAAPLARGILNGQNESRGFALKLLAQSPSSLLSRAKRLDVLRRKMERWTDVLLGYLVHRYGLRDVAFHDERAAEFGERQVIDHAVGSQLVWRFILAGMRLALPSDVTLMRPVSVDDMEIVRVVLSTFPSDAFSGEGMLKSVLAVRVARSGLHPETRPVQPVVAQSAPRSGGSNEVDVLHRRSAVVKHQSRFEHGG